MFKVGAKVSWQGLVSSVTEGMVMVYFPRLLFGCGMDLGRYINIPIEELEKC